MNNRINIFEVGFDSLTKKELCAKLCCMLKSGKGQYVVTPNPEIIEYSIQDDEYRKILCKADLCIADGVGIIYASKLFGTPIKERIPGIEAGEMMLRLAAKRGESVYLLGGKDGVSEKAAEKLCLKYPLLRIAGTHHGYFEDGGYEDPINDINKSGASVLLVCMGYPRQEKWIYENIRKLDNIKVAMALGGSLDVYSGCVKRAPKLVCSLGFEWLWRGICIPGHLKRMKYIPKFACRAFARKFKR